MTYFAGLLPGFLGIGLPVVDMGWRRPETRPGRDHCFRSVASTHYIMTEERTECLTLKGLSVFLVVLVQTCSASIRLDRRRHSDEL